MAGHAFVAAARIPVCQPAACPYLTATPSFIYSSAAHASEQTNMHSKGRGNPPGNTRGFPHIMLTCRLVGYITDQRHYSGDPRKETLLPP
ncbi:hypothetical protein NDU88_007495 [Pleurodeles waltl]|uniref:Secreted protein n=1 Tax=Pleurodeles waltl TaxID=8319 RepID=A0AAV7U392_PLEWA|nr:hypothetical protein NDU88_007495 [Pleurodeles waltl]